MVEKALTREELLEEQYDESKNQSGGTEASPNLHENPEGITCDETPLVLVKEEVETLITPVVTRNEDSVSSGTEASPNLHETPEGITCDETPLVLVKEEVETLITPVVSRNELLLLIATKDEKKKKDTRKDNIAKFKNTIGSWKCEICMMNNVSDKVECAACGSVKPGAEVIKEQKQDSKSLFTFEFGASSSGGVFSFGSGGTSQGDSKPVFTFGSQN